MLFVRKDSNTLRMFQAYGKKNELLLTSSIIKDAYFIMHRCFGEVEKIQASLVLVILLRS